MDDAINFQASLRAQDASRRAQERLELLLDLTNRVVSTLDLRDLLQVVAANLRRVMQSEGVGIQLPNPENGRLRLYALDFPGSHKATPEWFPPPPQSPFSPVFQTADPL